MFKCIETSGRIWLFVLILLISCNSNSENSTSSDEQSYLEAQLKEQLCFLFTEEHQPIIEGRDTLLRMIDSTILKLNLSAHLINGSFENKPAEKDAMIGTLVGSKRDNGLINASYHYSQEGGYYDHLVQIFITEDKAHLRFVNDTNQIVGQLNDSEWLTIPKVECTLKK